MIFIVLAIAASTGVGIAAERRWGGRAEHAAREAMLAVLYFAVPFVVFFNLARVHIDVDLGGGVLLGYVAVGIAATLAWVIGRYAFDLPRPSLGALIVCVVVANTGFLGYPMVLALLGRDAIGEATVYDILVSAPSLLLVAFAIGAAFGETAGEGVRDRVIAFFTRNPPLYAAIAALLVPDSLAPDVMVDISRIVVVAILPLGFFAVGVSLAAEAEEGAFRFPPRLTAPVAVAIALRLVLAPGLLYLMALPLINLPGPYLLLAAMPCGINTMIVAHAYGLDLRIAAEAVIWSTAIVVIAGLAGSALL